MISNFKPDMMMKYEVSDLGIMHYFLGIEIVQSVEGIFITQKKYAKTILKKFKMLGCKSVATPLVVNENFQKEDGSGSANESIYRSLVGSLLYLTATRPDLMYAASLLSRFMHKPTKVHYGAAKRILRYIQGTIEFGIMYERNVEPKLFGFCDSDWGGSVDDLKSTSGYTFILGTGVFYWASKKQKSVALSTAEAEYVFASIAISQAIWLKRVIEDFGEKQNLQQPFSATTSLQLP
ncbi:secreted RxLR effector protein 161-like [Rosa chinensis]|uniref:secreted RxLR effector protein 161-like n=1 Tax=Rosa chinensis TaxID=74649 RepID=UPI000D095C3B|nr:secreted RxLR effector protein 161-like [Rosa chinensis]